MSHVTGTPGSEVMSRSIVEPGPIALRHASRRSSPVAVRSFGSFGRVTGTTTDADIRVNVASFAAHETKLWSLVVGRPAPRSSMRSGSVAIV